MAWIEDSAKGVLLVRQATGSKLWTLPGGKVKLGESLVKALRREVHEETGLRCRLVLCSAYWIGVTKMRSRCCLLRSLTEDQLRLKRNKGKSRKRRFKHPYRIKLRRRLNTFGPRGKAQSKKHLEFEPPHINSRTLENRAVSLAVAPCHFANY